MPERQTGLDSHERDSYKEESQMMGRALLRSLSVVAASLSVVLFCALAACSPASSTSAETTTTVYADSGIHETHNVACTTCHVGEDESTYVAPETETCLSCHGGSYEKLGTSTEGLIDVLGYNPHASHYGYNQYDGTYTEDLLDCTDCHSNHGTSQLWCSQCHVGFLLPDGWDAKPME